MGWLVNTHHLTNSVALPPYLTVWIGVQTITLLVSLHLPLCSALLSSLSLTLLFPLSLSYCGGLQCYPNPDWSSVIGLTLPSSAREGISFLFWLYPHFPNSDCDIPCGFTTLFHRVFRSQCTKHTTCCRVGLADCLRKNSRKFCDDVLISSVMM